MQVFSSCSEWALPSSCGAQASDCSGFSCCRPQALGAQASAVVAHSLMSCGSGALEHMGFSSCSVEALECRLSSCGSQALTLEVVALLCDPGAQSLLAVRTTTPRCGHSLCGLHALALWVRAMAPVLQ